MGKGGGCVPSKKKAPKVTYAAVEDLQLDGGENNLPISVEATLPEVSVSDDEIQETVSPPLEKLKIFIVFYSMYGHVESLARRMKNGIDGVDGVEGVLYRVEETLPEEVLEKMQAPPKDPAIPVISAADLAAADGILFGFPTRYGCMAAQMKAFFDSTGQLWKEQRLAGKPAGFFVSTGTQGGGQETTAWTAITQLAHHGMLFVPIGYTFGAGMFKMDSIRGGSPYGAGVFAGDGTRQPSETELALAEHQGKYMAAVTPGTVHTNTELEGKSPEGKDRVLATSIPAIIPATMIGREGGMPDQWIQDEREVKRQKRKQSNRESARRSRSLSSIIAGRSNWIVRTGGGG